MNVINIHTEQRFSSALVASSKAQLCVLSSCGGAVVAGRQVKETFQRGVTDKPQKLLLRHRSKAEL